MLDDQAVSRTQGASMALPALSMRTSCLITVALISCHRKNTITN